MKALSGRVSGWWSSKTTIPHHAGISMIETLVALAVGSTLVVVIAAAALNSVQKAKNAICLARMRNLGTAILLYSQDNGGEFPRSLHSASVAGKTPWGMAILPYLGCDTNPSPQKWERIFNTVYRCPCDKNRDTNIWSYALNVFFELTPDGDDYDGSPQTWRRFVNVPHGGATILLAEPKTLYYADHIMCHQWTSAKAATNAIDALRHGKTANYLFVDAHVESLTIETTYDPKKGVNRWNPSIACMK